MESLSSALWLLRDYLETVISWAFTHDPLQGQQEPRVGCQVPPPDRGLREIYTPQGLRP